MLADFQITHYPVLHKEVISVYKECLGDRKNLKFIDGTAGEGGHVRSVLDAFPGSEVLYLDRDEDMIQRSQKRLHSDPRTYSIVKNFSELNRDDLIELGWEDGVDGILLDLGISIYHLTESGRGFSFRGVEELDMRLTRDIHSGDVSAYDIINTYPGKELERVFYDYGEERWTKKIVEKILERRKTNPVRTNSELAKLVESSIPRKFWPPKNHPSLRVFQALRIEVNQELYHLEKSIEILPGFLKEGGVFSIISFHSLEDRIVKHRFRDISKSNEYNLVYKKPILPTDEEVKANPPSRSAKLRSIQKSILHHEGNGEKIDL